MRDPTARRAVSADAGHVPAAEALARVADLQAPSSHELFRHGTLQVEVYAPRGTDPQTRHGRDEVYVVLSGMGTFFDGVERRPFGPGDFLFVAAGREHRFEDFGEDFATWVLFYGPEGGERQPNRPLNQ